MIATLAITMPSRLALGEPKENMICASAVAAGKVDQFALQIEQTVIAFASAIFLLWLQFDYLVSLFFIVFDFAPKHPSQCEHRIEQHGDDTIEQECSRAHVNVPSLPRVVALDTKRGFLTVIPIHKGVLLASLPFSGITSRFLVRGAKGTAQAGCMPRRPTKPNSIFELNAGWPLHLYEVDVRDATCLDQTWALPALRRRTGMENQHS